MSPTPRRYDLDWLRVLAILGVFVFHSTRFFNDHSWHVFNWQSSEAAAALVLLFSQWGMPFIFVVSGASIFFAVRPGRAGRFQVERCVRLLVPLALGLVNLTPPQVYLERLTHGAFRGSLWDFLPHYLDGIYGEGGNFAWQGLHLWYLEVLFVFTVVLLPLFVSLKRPAGERVVRALARVSRVPGVIFVWSLAIALVMVLLDPAGIGQRNFGGWSLFTYPLFLLFGFLIYANDEIQSAVVRQRWVALGLAGVLSVVLVKLAPRLPLYPFGSLEFSALMVIDALYAWSWCLLFLGFGLRHLQRDHPLRVPLNEGVLPFYVLHQPALLVVGYFVVQWHLPILAKWLIITPAALALTLAVYDLGIRRWGPMRALFGLKVHPPAHAPAPRPLPKVTAHAPRAE
jgi:peptidoglycan/LPS O-acetylase OafA/YrhL